MTDDDVQRVADAISVILDAGEQLGEAMARCEVDPAIWLVEGLDEEQSKIIDRFLRDLASEVATHYEDAHLNTMHRPVLEWNGNGTALIGRLRPRP